MLQVPGLIIMEDSVKGRGVYTTIELNKGDLIEICPIIKFPQGQLEHIDKSVLFDYYFLWEEDGYQGCVALGYGSIYNHSSEPNAIVIFDYTDSTIKIECSQKVNIGDELLIDYTGDGIRTEDQLWFKPV